jgi:putative tryptophan/tyrosine transport system substrate-binding protein
MASVMDRRAFLTGMVGVLAAPLVVEAQQAAPRRIGFLAAGSAGTTREWIEAFANRLRELGWIEGSTIAVEYRYAEGRPERFEEIAADFVTSKVDVIVSWGTPTVSRPSAPPRLSLLSSPSRPIRWVMVSSRAWRGQAVTSLVCRPSMPMRPPSDLS